MATRKWEGDRTELAALLEEIAPEGSGVAPGPLAAAMERDTLKAEAEKLAAAWAEIGEKAAASKPPLVLRDAPALADRILREAHGPVVMDDPKIFPDQGDGQADMPDLAAALELYKGKSPLFDETGVEEQLDEALSPRVGMPGGASLVIEETEALTAIDVNMAAAADAGSLTTPSARPTRRRHARWRGRSACAISAG